MFSFSDGDGAQAIADLKEQNVELPGPWSDTIAALIDLSEPGTDDSLLIAT